MSSGIAYENVYNEKHLHLQACVQYLLLPNVNFLYFFCIVNKIFYIWISN